MLTTDNKESSGTFFNTPKSMAVSKKLDVEEASSEDEKYAHWKYPGQHIIFFLAYLLDWHAHTALFYDEGYELPEYEPNIIQYITIITIVGAPLIFLQTFLGFFTQNGCLCLGQMMPISYGVGFLMPISSIVKVIFHIFYQTKLMFYFFSSLSNPDLPWICCDEYYMNGSDPRCFSLQDIDLCPPMDETTEPCFDPKERVLAAVYFMKYSGLSAGEPYTSTVEYVDGNPRLGSLLHFFGIILIAAVMCRMNFRNFESTVRVSFYFCVASSLTILTILATREGCLFGLQNAIRSISMNSFLSMRTWRITFIRLMSVLKFDEGGLIVFGALMSMRNRYSHVSLRLTTGYIVLVVYLVLIMHAYEGILYFKIKLSMKDFDMNSEEYFIFLMLPVSLGMQAFGKLFCCLIYLILIIMSLMSMAIKVFVIEKSISLHFKLVAYYTYIRVAACIVILGAFCALLFALDMDGGYYMKRIMKVTAMLVVVLQILTIYLYGIQRFYDDVEFYFQRKVDALTKISWVLTPIWLLMEIVDSKITCIGTAPCSIIYIAFVVFIVIPVLIGFMYSLIALSRKKNLIGIMRPIPQFGPPDIQLKIFRIIFNPRLSVKYKRHKEVCLHSCLNESLALEKAMEEEIRLMENLILELERSDGTENIEGALPTLKKHLEILQNRPKRKKLDY